MAERAGAGPGAVASVRADSEPAVSPDSGPIEATPSITDWPRFVLALVVVAVAAAGFAIAFRGTLAAMGRWLGGASDVVDMIRHVPLWARVVMPAGGGLAAGLISMRASKQRGVGGVGGVMEAVVLGRPSLSVRRTLLQSAASWCAIATGNSLGREGPLIQFGAAAGEAARRAFKLRTAPGRAVIAAGVAAGFAAAYNTPFAAVLFVVEIVTGVVVMEAVVPVLIATVIATVLTRAAIGAGPIYGARGFALVAPAELAAFVGLGVFAGLVGVGFLRALSAGERGWDKLPRPWRNACGGLVAGAILVALPEVAGNGYEPLDALLDGKLAVGLVAWLVIAKPAATIASVGSGNPGGVFTPTLLIGGCAGALYGAGLHAVLGDAAIGSVGGYALVGLAAALAATTHAPLTAAVMAFELSGDYAIVLPLVIATATAAALARRLQRDSVYTAELARRGLSWTMSLDGRRIVEERKPGGLQ
nr:chloride channel protein [Kofleriaceae bacterium]